MLGSPCGSVSNAEDIVIEPAAAEDPSTPVGWVSRPGDTSTDPEPDSPGGMEAAPVVAEGSTSITVLSPTERHSK